MRTIKQIIFGVFLISLVSSCNDKDIIEPTTPTVPTTPLAIGDSYQGGTIFYLDGTGQHGLIVAPKDDYNLILPGATRSFDFYVSGLSSPVGTQLQKVNFTITHQDVYDVEVNLVAPNGVIIELAYSSVSVHGANFTNTTIQTGGQSINGVSPPFTGTYSPYDPFSNLSSSTANGKWSLIVKNHSTTYNAELINATVTLNTTNFPVIMKTWNNGSNMLTTATGTVIGTGQANTLAILKGCDSVKCAARLCDELVLNGFSDWYLPSKAELNLLYLSKGYFRSIKTDYYWSSTESDAGQAECQDFYDGHHLPYEKNKTFFVRAVRSF